MNLLGNTRELRIVRNEQKNQGTERLEYPLYEANYISGIREIFKEAIKQSNLVKKNKGTFLLEEKRNVYAFIGKRGTGKTTAMNEFCQILKGLAHEENKSWWLEQALEKSEKDILWEKNFKFHVLNAIDASLLEDKENLFELIMANLYLEFKDRIVLGNRDYSDEHEKIQMCMKLFSEVFKSYRSINGHDNEDEYGNFIVSKMQFLRGSQQLQEKVVELINLLFKLSGGSYAHEYIVIPIDDLDLNVKHGYEMLEQLQKYFSYYKIVVVMALDYEQMGLVCEEHFRREMKSTTAAYAGDGRAHARELANDYMTKLFHFSQRMYMPDSRHFSRKSEIVLKKDSGKENEVGETRIQVKNFVVSKVAESMAIFYDACGNQCHFSEPTTVRGLVSYNEFLESLNVIDYEALISVEKISRLRGIRREVANERNKEILRQYDQNHERFNQDINIRMAQSIMLPYQKNAFDRLNTQPIEPRAQLFAYAHRDGDKIDFESVISEDYSYGQLLEKINGWGREKDIGGSYLEDKPFVRGILASFTTELVREYLYYRYKMDDGENKYKMRLLGVLGSSFGNSWTGEAFPKVSIMINEVPKLQRYGYYKELEQKDFAIRLDVEQLKENFEKNAGKDLQRIIRKWLRDEEVVETLECIDMFFVRREGNLYQGMEYVFTYDYPVTKKVLNVTEEQPDLVHDAEKTEILQKVIIVNGAQKKIALDMMAFVAKSMNYEEEKQRLQANIIDGLPKALGECIGCSDNEKMMIEVKNAIKAEVEKNSLFAQLKEMKHGYEVAFPFYNLDMTYNVYKRVRRECSGKLVGEKDFLSGVVDFYACIEKNLRNEEKNYAESEIFNYLSIFNECPYIKMVKKINEKKDSNVQERLTRVFRTMVVDYKPEDIKTDRSTSR